MACERCAVDGHTLCSEGHCGQCLVDEDIDEAEFLSLTERSIRYWVYRSEPGFA